MAAATTPKPKPRPKGFAQRMTAKVGPLPVWAWALAILAIGYLIYRRSSSSSSSSTDSSSTDTSSTAPDASSSDSGTPGPDNTGGGSSSAGPDAATLNDQLLSQLSGFQSSIDTLTAAVLTSPAFLPGTGDAGSGSLVPNGVPSGTAPVPATTATHTGGTVRSTAAGAKHKPAPTLVSEHGRGGGYSPAGTKSTNVRYYTYAPGKAPKGKASQAAPARGPRGTTLHFAAGRGYYYA